MNICLKVHKENEYFEKRLKEAFSDNKEVNLSFSYKTDKLNLKDIDILITTSITESELIEAENLKVLHFFYTGVNHLPLDKIKERNIILLNSHAHASVVALRALSLALALLGRVVELHNQMKKGVWKGLNGTSTWETINNLRCGLLGMGAIGKSIVKYLQPFNVEIVTLSRYKGDNTSFTYYDSIKEVCLNSDIIFISLPLTEDTKDIIDEKILSELHNTYIVNVGRGAVINEEALYNALKNKTLKGAAIDTWYQYPENNNDIYPSRFPIHELDNVILSPHCSGNASNINNLIIDDIVNNIKAFVDKKKLSNIVNLDKGY